MFHNASGLYKAFFWGVFCKASGQAFLGLIKVNGLLAYVYGGSLWQSVFGPQTEGPFLLLFSPGDRRKLPFQWFSFGAVPFSFFCMHTTIDQRSDLTNSLRTPFTLVDESNLTLLIWRVRELVRPLPRENNSLRLPVSVADRPLYLLNKWERMEIGAEL